MTDKQIEDYGITVTGNTGWTDVADGGPYELSINSPFFIGSTSGTVIVNKGTPIINGVITGGDFYEDRLSANTIIGNATSSAEGKFEVLTELVYGEPETGVTYDTIYVEWVFTPEDTINYNVVEEVVNINIYPVAYVGTTYYGTVDKAIINSTSGTIVIIPGTNPIIKSDLTLKAGVTLFMPYEESLTLRTQDNFGQAEIRLDTNTSFDFNSTTKPSGAVPYDYDSTFVTQFLKSTLTISENKKLTIENGAVVEISGQLSAGGGGCNTAGHTAGWYSKIVLESNAQIINNGVVNCYGYILESSKNNGSMLINNKEIYMPFVLRDFRGGSIMAAVYNSSKKISPFNQFEFRNISVLTRTNYEGKIYTWANLYAGDKYNYTLANMVGNESSAVIQFTNNTYSYMTCKFDFDTEIHALNIYGGAKTNSLTMKIDSITVDTASVYFPISWRFDITLNKNIEKSQNENAQFTMSQNFKMMPGAKMTISSGTSVTVKDLNVYTSFTDEITYQSITGSSGTVPKYQDRSEFAKIPAKLIVNGSLTADALGGYVYTEGDGATLSVTKASLETLEPKHVWSASIMSNLQETTSISETLKLVSYNSSEFEEKASGTYYSKDSKWFSAKITINYHNNGNVEEKVYDADVNGLPSSRLTVPEYKGYTFGGWYYDENFANPVNDYIYNDVDLYAKWTLDEYTINYVITKDSSIQESYTLPNDLTTSFSIETADSINIYLPTFNNYVFDGWYSNEERTLLFNSYSYDALIEKANNDKVITLFAHWSNSIYRVEYDFGGNPNNISLDNSGKINKEEETFDLQDATAGDSNPTLMYYFGGWYYDSAYTLPVSTNKTSDLAQHVVNNSITIYAKWNKKVEVITSVGTNCPDSSLKVNGATSSSLYYMVEELGEYIFTPDSNFEAPNSAVETPYYFVGWYVGDIKLPANVLTQDIINNTNEEDIITVEAKWILKNTIDVKITSKSLNSTTIKTLYYVPYNNVYGVQVKFVVPTLEDYLVGDYAKYKMFDADGVATEKSINGSAISNGQEIELTNETSIDVEVKELYQIGLTITNSDVTIALSKGKLYDSSLNETKPSTYSKNTTLYILEDSEFTVTYTKDSFNEITKDVATFNGSNFSSGYEAKATGNITIVVQREGNCVAEGTLITMADGSKKEVQFIESGDLLYVFNHETGQWDIAEVLFNDKEELNEFTVINLEFSNGSLIKVVSEHGFFDLELMKYVYITENNYHEFIDHRFVSGEYIDGNIETGIVTLNKAYITQETIRVYSPVTKYHLNYLTEDILSMPGGITGLFNIFEYDESLKYNEELMNIDIEKYGLFTYEDFEGLVSEDIYNSFPTQYFKVAIEKGILTWDQLYYYIDRYAPLM